LRRYQIIGSIIGISGLSLIGWFDWRLAVGAFLGLASWFGPFRQFVLAHPWDVEGLGNIHPVVVAAVGMWESLLSDFQGLWEGWENSFIVFPCFP
jgi:hypothetical protein